MQKIMFNDQYGLTKAVLAREKTQTRRIIEGHTYVNPFGILCQGKLRINEVHKIEEISRYSIGEILAVAESYRTLWETEPDALLCSEASQIKAYFAKHYPDYTAEQISNCAGYTNKMFVKADFMPHQIRITDIRLERLQDISDSDCQKEGIQPWNVAKEFYHDKCVSKSIKELEASGITPYQIPGCWNCFSSPKEAYSYLIDKVSGKGTWEKNPWVFVYDFVLMK